MGAQQKRAGIALPPEVAALLLSDTSDAPPSLKRLAAVIGWREALVVGRELAGTRIYIPKSPALMRRCALAWYLKRRSLSALAASELAGEAVEVPGYFMRKKRDLDIRKQNRAGFPPAALAARHGLSLSHVKTILRSHAAG